MRPSDVQIPVFYPNDDPSRGGGMDQGDFDNGEVGSDNLRTIAELLTMPTFNRLEPQFQRNYIALAVAAKIEADLLLGVGTGWRDWDQQLANWQRDPQQFANPIYSLHMNRGKYDVAYAIDTVPYDALDWAHANCARFGINYLDHIAHERHHCQPIQIPNGGSQFNDHYADLAREVLDLPYLRTMPLAAWLERDSPIYIDGRPEAPPDPSEEDDMAQRPRVYLAYCINAKGVKEMWRGNGTDSNKVDEATQKGIEGRKDFAADGRMCDKYVNPNTGDVYTHLSQVVTLTANQIIADLGRPRS